METRTLWVQEKVRTGVIELRKDRGDVNPADLFTKHLPSRDKIHQLVKLFGCECRAGRSELEAAPLLRPQESSGGKGGQPSTGHLPAFVVLLSDGEEDHQEPDGPSALPHLYGKWDRDRLFPGIHAPPRGPNDEDWIPGLTS